MKECFRVLNSRLTHRILSQLRVRDGLKGVNFFFEDANIRQVAELFAVIEAVTDEEVVRGIKTAVADG